MVRRSLLVAILLVVSIVVYGVIFSLEKPKSFINKGVVAELNFLEPKEEKEYRTIYTGKFYIPRSKTIVYPEAYEVVVSGTSDNGDKITTKYYVNKKTFETLKVGDYIVYDENYMLRERPTE